ncbi:MAG: bi-domain-containing oxidoreductase [Coriobacteriia bacterium]
MKQVLVRSGEVVVEEVPAPVAGPGMVLVSVSHSAVSVGTELSSVRSSGVPLWRRALRQPENVKRVVDMMLAEGISKTRSVVEGKLRSGAPTGYSAAGAVLALGEGVTDLAVGQLVACAGAGVANHAEVVAVPRNLVVSVPDGVASAEASTVTLGAIALQGVRRVQPTLGETFVVIGLGVLGQLTSQILKANGCRIFVSDLDSTREQRALALGADGALGAGRAEAVEAILRLTDGHGADGVIITATSRSNDIVSTAFKLCRKKGRVVLVGDVGLDIDRSDIYEKELDFLVSTSYGPGRYDTSYEEDGCDYPIGYVRWTENRNMAEYLRLVAEGRIDVQSLTDRTYLIDDAPEAYSALQSGEGAPLLVLLEYPRPNEARISRRVSAPGMEPVKSDKVRLTLIGAGSFAKAMHLPGIAALSNLYTLRGVVSRTGHNASEVAKRFGACFAATDPAEAFSDDETDAVLIATRHDSHASLALQALEAGKHVLVEKPLALNPDELAEVLAFFEGKQSAPLLMTGFNRRFSPHVRRIAELVADRTSPMVITYRMNAGYVAADHWVHDPVQGGGRNIGEACHIYDLFDYLTGAKVVDVTAAAIAPRSGKYSPADNFTMTATFEDGSVATLVYTSMGAQEHPKEQMEVFCDGTVYVLDDYKTLTVRGSSAGGVRTQMQDKGHKQELVEFAEALKTACEPPIPLWQQAQAMEIAFSVEDALRGR